MELRKIEHLPDTIVETDSYVAAQLLEKEGAVNLSSLSNMAEKARGSFTFTVLNRDGLYIVRGTALSVCYILRRDSIFIPPRKKS